MGKIEQGGINFTPNENFKYYFKWISERMNIFWNRYEGQKPPYTEDPILLKHKFTNVYRSLDRVSQYFIRNIVNTGDNYSDHDLFWRILMFKHFNKIETWEWLIKDLGDIVYSTTKEEIVSSLNKYQEQGLPVYSNAFMLTAPFMRNDNFLEEFEIKKGSRKYDIYLSIFTKHFKERGNTDRVLAATSLGNLFELLTEVPSFASFLGMQFTTDYNYSRLFDFDENSFIIASVGSKRGIDRTFTFEGKPNYEDVLYWVRENFVKLSNKYGYTFDPLTKKNGEFYLPTLMDLQNDFCETDKYLRGLGIETEGVKVHGKRIKNQFVESVSRIDYSFPNKWEIDL